MKAKHIATNRIYSFEPGDSFYYHNELFQIYKIGYSEVKTIGFCFLTFAVGFAFAWLTK